ncbi:MAG: hypothetical protein JJU45_08110 [Acidimicrobiia bacterium]|nr:hypothetical protein [Acidimicrobiia bacterium]
MSSTSPPWRVVVEFLGVDLDDDAVVDALICEPEREIAWSSTDGATTADATVYAETATSAIDAVIDAATAVAPGATVLRLVDPLVTILDIAEDAGVTRQAVRNWATGTRQSGFPRPLAVVGDGVRVWRHADVDAWLTASLDLGTGRRFLSAAFVANWNEQLTEQSTEPSPIADHSVGEWQLASERTEFQTQSVERPRVIAPVRERRAPAR